MRKLDLLRGIGCNHNKRAVNVLNRLEVICCSLLNYGSPIFQFSGGHSISLMNCLPIHCAFQSYLGAEPRIFSKISSLFVTNVYNEKVNFTDPIAVQVSKFAILSITYFS